MTASETSLPGLGVRTDVALLSGNKDERVKLTDLLANQRLESLQP
jgi:hypothetical protein